MDAHSFIVHVKTEDIYKYISENVETGFDTSKFELDRPLPIGKSKKVTGSMEDELGGQTMKKMFDLKQKRIVI